MLPIDPVRLTRKRATRPEQAEVDKSQIEKREGRCAYNERKGLVDVRLDLSNQDFLAVLHLSGGGNGHQLGGLG